jgi:hypothetical protein
MTNKSQIEEDDDPNELDNGNWEEDTEELRKEAKQKLIKKAHKQFKRENKR